METDFTLLAQNAGTTLVTLMTTDAWRRVSEGITQLWRTMQPQRAEHVAAELASDREEVLAAVADDDQQTLDELRMQWQGRFRRFLVAHPEALDEVRRLVAEFDPPGPATGPSVTQHAVASGHARIHQAGRDQHIAERTEP